MTAYYTATALRTAVAPALDNTTKYPADMLDGLVAEFTALVETHFGVAFTPTSATETIEVPRAGPLLLSHSRVTAVASLTYTDSQGPSIVVADDLDFSSGWSIIRKEPSGQYLTRGRRVTVTYTHGYTITPPAVLRACRLYVKNEAQAEKSAMPASAASVESDATGYGFQFDRIDPANGKITRWPNVNAALAAVPNERIPGIA